MKKLIFAASAIVVFSLLLVSCQKEETATDETTIQDIALSTERVSIEPAELPTSINSYLQDYFFDTYVEEAFVVEGRGYECDMGSGDILFFNREGRILEFRNPNGPFGPDGPHGPCHRRGRGFGEPVAIADLPAAIGTYVADNYPGSEMLRAKVKDDEYYVAISGFLILKFDSEGTFIEELTPIHNCLRRCNPLALDELPGTASGYIAENFADAEFRRACQRRGRIVVFMLGDEGRIILIFDAEGNFLFQRG
jgi:hypothetical protein